MADQVKISNNCFSCKKKLLLTDFACKCEKRFCVMHRFPEVHSCTYDYKEVEKQNLSKNLVKADGDKMTYRL